MTIKIAPPDHEHSATFGSIDVGQVFRVAGQNTYYMRVHPVTSNSLVFDTVDLCSGHFTRGFHSGSIVIPVTLEAKEVQS